MEADDVASTTVKSGLAVTVRDKLWVLSGAPEVLAVSVIGVTPVGVAVVVPIVSVTVTGVLEVGVTELEGEKLQLAPVGNPLQASETVPLKDPAPVTWNVIGFELFGSFALRAVDENEPMPKSTTWSVRGKSCVTVFVSDPTPCTLKL